MINEDQDKSNWPHKQLLASMIGYGIDGGESWRAWTGFIKELSPEISWCSTTVAPWLKPVDGWLLPGLDRPAFLCGPLLVDDGAFRVAPSGFSEWLLRVVSPSGFS
eukprot:Skav221410  [mRNA]  locus=scaffold1621:205638:206541:- [translate_table: standard]